MNRLGRSCVLLGMGVLTLRLILTDEFGWFVQQRMRLPLLAAAIALLLLGVAECLTAFRDVKRDDKALERRVGPLVGWLLILPGVVLMAVAPTGLSSAAVDRLDTLVPAESDSEFVPLAESAAPIKMRVYDFIDRAVWDDAKSLEGTRVELEGLVVNDERIPDGFRLTRFLVSCCAADGIPMQIGVHQVDQRFANDTWVRVVGTWRPPAAIEYDLSKPVLVELDVESIEVLTDPRSPYESAW